MQDENVNTIEATEVQTSAWETAFDYLEDSSKPRVSFRVYDGAKGSVYVETVNLGRFDVQTSKAVKIAGAFIQTATTQSATLVKVTQHSYVSADVMPLAGVVNEDGLKLMYKTTTRYFAIFDSGSVYLASYHADTKSWRVDRTQLIVEQDGKRYNAANAQLAKQAAKHANLIDAGATTDQRKDNVVHVRDSKTDVGVLDSAIYHYYTARAMLSLDEDDSEL